MRKINVLITGAASGVGQSIIRSLIYSKIKSNLNIIISDITKLNSYPIYKLKYLTIPKVEQRNSKQLFKKILIRKKINVLLFRMKEAMITGGGGYSIYLTKIG